MRLWHLLALVAAAAVMLALIRTPLGPMLLVGIPFFLVMYWMDSADRWMPKRYPKWSIPARGMLVLAGATLYVMAVTLTLKLAIGLLSF